jgi:hypothetical protein
MAKPMKPAQQLAAVMDRQRYLAATVDECEYRSRFAATEVGDAQAAVEAAQRALLTGKGEAAAFTAAESELAQARERQGGRAWASTRTRSRSSAPGAIATSMT